MKNKKLIGISGKKRSGKNQVAIFVNELLVEAGHKPYEEKAFAYYVKKFCSEMTGIPMSGWETEADKDKLLGPEWAVFDDNGLKIQITRRKFMQRFGSDAVTAHLHPNAWVNALFGTYNSYSAKGSDYEFEQSRWLVTDVRFPNEVKAVQVDRPGYLIRVQRPATDNHGDSHSSETALDKYQDWDFVIVNDGSLEQLREKVKNILKQIELI